ncbi:hypothetical protein [Helicobacter himalayensis]|uniref:hypothetical protein n=1 Tax=Helicobacter himalayensis TaxID=1591088 RepID=UPI00082A1ED8|nr:hypothetical protein [Helicobacter himalayensis]
MPFQKLTFFACALVLLFSACSHKDAMDNFTNSYYNGDLQKAYKLAKENADGDDIVLWGMQAGIVGAQLEKKESYELLDKSEQVFSQYEAQGLLSGVFDNVGAVILNENIKTYRGNMYEGVLLNYYKALISMRNGENALARVEFNRANDRQRRAKDYFQKDIQKALDSQREENSQDSHLKQVDSAHTASSAQSYLENNYQSIKTFSAYKNFINPAVSYVSALFFLLESDNAKALDLYKQAYGISKAEVINQDIALLQERQRRVFKPHTWVIIEEGQSPTKEELELNFPAYLVSSDVLHVGLALPKLTPGRSFYNDLNISKDSKNLMKASLVADFEGVISNEFNEQLPFITTRAVSSAVLKAVTQATLRDYFGYLGSLAGLVYSAATTSADVRISSVLPYRIYALQVKNAKGVYELKNGFTTLLRFEIGEECGGENLALCQKNDNILYVRLRATSLSVQILRENTP